MKSRILFSWLFLLVVFTGSAQNFYEIKWTASDNIVYTALVEFFSKDNINVRVKYTVNSSYRVAKYTCRGEYYTTQDNQKTFRFDGSNAKVIYPLNSPYGYSADNFLFSNIDDNGIFKYLYVYDDQDLDTDGKIDNLKSATFKKLDPGVDFTGAYIYSFFEKNEPEYDKYRGLSNSGFYKIKLTNNCSSACNALIYYKNLQGYWVTKGWCNINPGETAYMEDSREKEFYFYAVSTDNSLTWKGDYTFNTQKGSYGFRKLTTNTTFGDWNTNITCTNSTEIVDVSALKLHLIVVADTQDTDIRNSTRQDMESITYLFRNASRELGMQYSETLINGWNLEKDKVLEAINNLSVGSNDAILFYYSGHGYNNPANYSLYPTMSLHGDDMGLEEIHALLKRKKARLTMTIGDLCNSNPALRYGTERQVALPFKSGPLYDASKLKKLLVLSKGDLISSSSQKGEWSFCCTNNDGSLGGGQFTNAFISAFKEEASKVSNCTGVWSSLLSRAYNEAVTNTRNQKNQNGSFGQHGRSTCNIIQ